MSALPRPDLPVGPHRDLNDALHQIHLEAGWPSLRVLAREAGCSHTTVSGVFSSARLPSWGVLEVIVEVMGGDATAFRGLWLAASSPDTVAGPVVTRIAGRRDELAAVRRHFQAGAGLLLVTGEAGIGKTKLVNTAATLASATDGVFVAAGSCLPLSSKVPLLPVADALRVAYASDTGGRLEKALAQSAPYVRTSLGILVPELDQPEARSSGLGDDDWARQRLFAAVESTLAGLASERRFSLFFEDLHWADAATLDLLEHLLTRRPAIPILATWRLDDQTIDRSNVEWYRRVRRTPTVTTLPLSPLSRDETESQLALLTGQPPDAELVDAVYRRTQGQPLFTEHLAAHSDKDLPFPSLLADLLDARLGDLTGPPWLAARALGVADRPLTSPLLAEITGLTGDELATGLHDLDDRRLLAASSKNDAALRHPLLAEAIRRRLVAGEASSQHAAVAEAMASSMGPEPGEVARHWQAAGDREQELIWRVRAARVAHARFALQQEAEEWLRVLDLWPEGAMEAGQPAIRRHDALASVMELWVGIERERSEAFAEECLALAPKLPPLEAAQLLYLAGDHYAHVGQRELGLDLLHRAIGILEEGPPSVRHVVALKALEFALHEAGRKQEAAAAATRGLEVSEQLGDAKLHRRMLILRGGYDVRQGEIAMGMSRARQAAEMVVEGPDPRGEAALVSEYTDLLLHTAVDVEEVVSAGQKGLDSASTWDLGSFAVMAIRYSMAKALRRAGQVRRAAALIEPHTGKEPPEDRWRLLHLERARLDMLQGQSTDATALVDRLRAMSVFGLDELIEISESIAEVDVWTGRPQAAYDQVIRVADEAAPTEAAADLGPLLTLAARAAADGPQRARADRLDQLIALQASCLMDPFAGRPAPADSRAWAATWRAEISRLRDRQSIQSWTSAIADWDELARPHDAAYCRWQAGVVALTSGHGTVAKRLLRQAARDAREHAPLTAAIGVTIANTASSGTARSG